ncbi:hypothetical protein GQ54DRAFT_313999 [Martensiomyces pterosporus]|nr:hypothetical protein GQ54DRAFT_313999 [Martensiomyces pterosporus]
MKLFIVAFSLAIAASVQKTAVACSANSWASRLAGRRISEGPKDWRAYLGLVYSVQDLPQFHRIIHPGDFVTSDYRPDRLSITVDGKGAVVNVECK